MNKYGKAIEYFMSCEELYKKVHNNQKLLEMYDSLSEIYKNVGNTVKEEEFKLKSAGMGKLIATSNAVTITNGPASAAPPAAPAGTQGAAQASPAK